MQIVIDIPEDVYNRFTHNEVRPRCEITEEERFQMNADAVRLTRAFCNGTPLPKGHGRLIDADVIPSSVELKGFLTQDDMHLVTIDRVKQVLSDLPTIIEADKEA